MGLWDTLKQHAGAQFLDVIQWLDDSNNTLVYRFPVFNQAITANSKLIVREGQAAVFVSEGQLSEVFGPGSYTLDTKNTPIMSFFGSIKYGLNYPYKGDILFISTRQFTDNKWGTANPVMLRDPEFGPVRIRAFGIFSYRVTDPASFIRQVVGTDGLFTTDEINGQLKRKLVAGAADGIANLGKPILDIAGNYLALGDQLRDRVNPTLKEAYGITLTDFTVENVSLPEEVEKALDTRSKMGVLGNLDAYAKMNAAEAIHAAAANPGIGGAGVGLGVGLGMGQMMSQQFAGMASAGQFNPQTGQSNATAAPPPVGAKYHYSGPAGQAELTGPEIAQRIAANRSADHQVWAVGWPGWKSWREVPEIAGMLPPPAAAPPAPPQVKFHYAGSGGDGEKSSAEIAAILRADPGGAHHVWKAGFEGWKPANEVPEIQAAMGAMPPPPPRPPGPPPR